MIRNFGRSKTCCDHILRIWDSIVKVKQNEIESLSSKEGELFKSIKADLYQLIEYYNREESNDE